MKILVTGGNGFLGSWVVKRLIEDNHQVKILHRPHSDLSSLNGLKFESAIGDVTDPQSLLMATKDSEAVFHIAGLISYSSKDNDLMKKINVQGTANVVDACIKAGVRRLIFTSSVVAVGASFKPEILNEESPYTLQKFNLGYYNTKKEAEDLIIDAVKNRKLDAVIVNPAAMFGPGDAVKGSRKTQLKVVRGELPFYPPGGVNVLHVDDAVSAHIQALKKGRSGERYILGGENLKIKDFFKMLAQAGGKKPPSIGLPSVALKGIYELSKVASKIGISFSSSSDSYLLSTLYHWYDSSKARQELEFRPRPAMSAIEESVAWSRAHGFLD